MSWELEEQDAYLVVRPLSVRLDASVAPELKTFVTGLAAEHQKKIVLDLINVDFMDSSGLGALVGCYKLTIGAGGLLICNIQDQVKDIFKLTHMDRIFEVHDDMSMCLERLAA